MRKTVHGLVQLERAPSSAQQGNPSALHMWKGFLEAEIPRPSHGTDPQHQKSHQSQHKTVQGSISLTRNTEKHHQN